MKDRLSVQKPAGAGEGEEGVPERPRRRRERTSRRKTLDSGRSHPEQTAGDGYTRDSESNLTRTRTNSVSSTEGLLGGDTSLRVASPSSVQSDKENTTPNIKKLTSPAKFEPGGFSSRESRVKSPESAQGSRVTSPDHLTTSGVESRVRSPEVSQHQESRMRSPDTVAVNHIVSSAATSRSTSRESPSGVRSPLSSRSQSRESGLCSPERLSSRPRTPEHPSRESGLCSPERLPSRPRTPDRATPSRSRSPDKSGSGSRPLSPATSNRYASGFMHNLVNIPQMTHSQFWPGYEFSLLFRHHPIGFHTDCNKLIQQFDPKHLMHFESNATAGTEEQRLCIHCMFHH